MTAGDRRRETRVSLTQPANSALHEIETSE